MGSIPVGSTRNEKQAQSLSQALAFLYDTIKEKEIGERMTN